MLSTSRIHLASWVVALSFMAAMPHAQADSLLNGLASHKELNADLFIGGLYTDTLSNDAATQFSAPGSKRLEVRVVAKRLSARRLNSLWIEGMAINNPPDLLTRQANNMVDFTRLVKRSLRAGDILAIKGDSDSTTVSLNGVELGSIPSGEFFDMMLRTWIGNVPLSSDFRDGLLTNGEVDGELLAQYESIQPSAARQQAVAKWVNPDADSAPDSVAEAAPAKPEPAPAQLAVAEPVKINTQIAKPQLATPAATKPEAADKPAASSPAKPKPAPAVAAKTTSKPEPVKPEPAKVEPAKPAAAKPKTQQIAKAAAVDEEEFFDDEEEFEEDSAPLLTAESLLSQQLYHSELLRWTYKYIEYPARAVDRRHEGSVRIAVVIDRKGEVMSVSEVEASKYSSLNREALRAVKRAAPFPPIPDAILGQEFAFSLPIVFKLPD